MTFLLNGCSTASATIYEVHRPDFVMNAELISPTDGDYYDIHAESSEHIRYSVTADTPGSCVQLFFYEGLGPGMRVRTDYSMDACVLSYSNEFSTEWGQAKDFTIKIETEYQFYMNYTMSIKLFTPGIPIGAVAALVLIFLTVVIVAVAAFVIVRSQKRTAKHGDKARGGKLP